MYIPDSIERMENLAEEWAFDNIRGDKFKCGCGKWVSLLEGQPISANPYSPPVCSECFEKFQNEIMKRMKNDYSS